MKGTRFLVQDMGDIETINLEIQSVSLYTKAASLQIQAVQCGSLQFAHFPVWSERGTYKCTFWKSLLDF